MLIRKTPVETHTRQYFVCASAKTYSLTGKLKQNSTQSAHRRRRTGSGIGGGPFRAAEERTFVPKWVEKNQSSTRRAAFS
jgi:hypothetical protein